MTQQDIEKNKDLIKIIMILVIVIIIAVAGKSILDSILEAIGLKDTAEDKKRNADVKKAVQNSTAFFSPLYFQQKPEGYKEAIDRINMNKARETAKKIYNSIGYIYDSPEKTRAAFSQLKYKFDVSKVAQVFQNDYQKDLLTFLTDKLDTEKQKENWLMILTDLNSLPSGFVRLK